MGFNSGFKGLKVISHFGLWEKGGRLCVSTGRP